MILRKKKFFKLIQENMRKHKDIKLTITKRRRSYLVSAQNFNAASFFKKNLLIIEIKENLNFYQ